MEAVLIYIYFAVLSLSLVEHPKVEKTQSFKNIKKQECGKAYYDERLKVWMVPAVNCIEEE